MPFFFSKSLSSSQTHVKRSSSSLPPHLIFCIDLFYHNSQNLISLRATSRTNLSKIDTLNNHPHLLIPLSFLLRPLLLVEHCPPPFILHWNHLFNDYLVRGKHLKLLNSIPYLIICHPTSLHPPLLSSPQPNLPTLPLTPVHPPTHLLLIPTQFSHPTLTSTDSSIPYPNYFYSSVQSVLTIPPSPTSLKLRYFFSTGLCFAHSIP